MDDHERQEREEGEETARGKSARLEFESGRTSVSEVSLDHPRESISSYRDHRAVHDATDFTIANSAGGVHPGLIARRIEREICATQRGASCPRLSRARLYRPLKTKSETHAGKEESAYWILRRFTRNVVKFANTARWISSLGHEWLLCSDNGPFCSRLT